MSITLISVLEIIIHDFIGQNQRNMIKSTRVLRIVRLLREFEFTKVIINTFYNSVENFINILLLLFIFLYIFTLLGMNLFGGETLKDNRQNWNSFLNSFICTFQIMTLENWNSLMYEIYTTPQPFPLSMFYLVLWIFIGNYVLLNLFLAILLDGFG